MESSKPKPEKYKRLQQLGEGSFGTAYLVKGETTGNYAVIKQVQIDQMDAADRRATIKEAKILEVMKHPNITSFKEVYKTKKGQLCIVMEYCDGGDLASRIEARQEESKQAGKWIYFSEDQVLHWFTQICLGVKHVHDRRILHRDLKAQNVFMTKKDFCKIGDFGVSSVLKRTEDRAQSVAGTPYYLAPELYLEDPYSFSADVWSLGIMLYEMCALEYPFNSDDGTQRALAREVLKKELPRLPSQFSDELNQVCAFMLDKDPTKRPNINQVLKHPLIKERIPALLSSDDFQEEFSHTVLHGRDVFAEKKAEKKGNLVDDNKIKKGFKPTNGVDEGHMQKQFQNYVDHLNDADKLKKPKDKDAVNPYKERDPHATAAGKTEENQDSDEGHDDSNDQKASEEELEAAKQALLGRSVMRNIEKELMDLTKAEYSAFSAKMGARFGQATFDQGYEILHKNKRTVIAGDDKEVQDLLKDLEFESEQALKDFIRFTSTYIIVHGVKY